MANARKGRLVYDAEDLADTVPSRGTLPSYARNVMSGVRKRARERAARAEEALKCFDSPYDEYGIARKKHLKYDGTTMSKSEIAQDAADRHADRLLLTTTIARGKRASSLLYVKKHRGDGTTAAANMLIDSILGYLERPLIGRLMGKFSPYQYESTGKLATPYRLDRPLKAGVDLIGIEPNPGPTHPGATFTREPLLTTTITSTITEEVRHVLDFILGPVEVIEAWPIPLWDWWFASSNIKFRRTDLDASVNNPVVDSYLDGCCVWAVKHLVTVVPSTMSLAPILLWRVNDRQYFKCAAENGAHSVHRHVFANLVARYNNAVIVSYASFATAARLLDPEIGDDTISCLFSLFGGNKGLRTSAYFCSPVYDTSYEQSLDVIVPRDITTEVVRPLVVHPAVVPATDPLNDNAAVQDRLYNIATLALEIPPDIFEYAREFARLYRPAHLVVPIDPADVITRQKTKITRERMIKAGLHIHNPPERVPTVQAFVKNEAYPEPKDVRNISGVDPEHNMWGFTFDIPLKEAVYSRIPAFFPGVQPSELPDRLGNALGIHAPNGFTVGGLCEGDYSRFDGTQSQATRSLIFAIMQDWIHPAHRQVFSSVCHAQLRANCWTKTGVRYDAYGSMLSGAWCTTTSNTLLNCFVIFTALRRLGVTARAARHLMGACFGDDSAFTELVRGDDRLSTYAVAAAADLGLRLEIIHRDNNIVSFLSRYYHINGRQVIASCPDVARLVPKFHLIHRRDAKIGDAAAKFSCLKLLCGDDTPILSVYLAAWFRLNKVQYKIDVEDLPYWLRDIGDLDVQFPKTDDILTTFVLEQLHASQGIDCDQIARFTHAALYASSMDELEQLVLDNREYSPNQKFNIIGHILNNAQPRALTPPRLPAQ